MANQAAFIEFMLDQDVLQFGEFTLKSGRQSPYFFNLGKVAAGAAFAKLGQAYAEAIITSGLEFDVLFGPAYKGIPIAVATSVALAEKGVEVGVAYNRKEAKDHGEGGWLVGADVVGRVLLIDDVLTSGKAIREAVALIEETDAKIVGAVIAMDRQEINLDGVTAVGALAEELKASVISIANMQDLIEYLGQDTAQTGLLGRMRSYQAEYCRL
ncbi:MAG: orotate phosphoribosyltransferase [Pseudomonadales bacterium]|nr:orotate phosphoribosyltransferase [Pseudomonadales bacterium]